MTGRHLLVGVLLLVAGARFAPPVRSTVPDSLTNEQFWALSTDLSEPGGTFRSDNLLSNERLLQYVIPSLARDIRPGTAYLGVGPEQNFTYIAALKPAIAFIVDIRRGNLQLHLLYKALFELSADRVDFVSKLFSRKRPAGLSPASSAEELFRAFVTTEPDPALFERNLAAVREHLTVARKLPLTADDLQAIEWVYGIFGSNGPLIQYSGYFGGSSSFPTYAELMTATDGTGAARSYLASADSFTFLKTLHTRNLIIPVVGDFAGPKALRAVGRYLKDKHATVGAFYLSNVEQYLGRENRWGLFCENVTFLPLDISSSFIRSIRDGNYGRGIGLASATGNMLAETRVCPR